MKFIISLLLLLFLLATTEIFGAQLYFNRMKVETGLFLEPHVNLRVGYFEENDQVPFRGNILYLQGLADSMLNHDYLFSELTSHGYRVIVFDYPGQGGSAGSMNDTKILSLFHSKLQIKTMANRVWKKFRNKQNSKKIVLGWSTGGLAGYEMAHAKEADAVILITPGICPSLSVGEGLINGNEITIHSLTSDAINYGRTEKDPHKERPRPKSPLLIPLFSKNLLLTSFRSKRWKIDKKIPGLVLHSGPADNYVDSQCNKRILDKNADHFDQVTYYGAKHEIDNEVLLIRSRLVSDILHFLQTIE